MEGLNLHFVEENINSRDDNRLALHWAVKNDDLGKVKQLLKNGANVNLADKYGYTALNVAVQYKNIQIAKLLLKNGAKVELIDNDGRTALHDAVRYGVTETVKLLLENDANVDLVDADGLSALHHAVIDILYLSNNARDTSKVELLFEHRANVAWADDGGLTALHWTVKEPHTRLNSALTGADIDITNKVVKMLLRNGANVNWRDDNGFTALHWAVIDRDLSTVKLLLMHGANFDLHDVHGFAALYVAVTKGCIDTAKLIINFVLLSHQLQEKPDFVKENTYISEHWDRQLKICYMLKNPSIGRPITKNTISELSKTESLKGLAITKFFNFLDPRKIEEENKAMQGPCSRLA